MSRAQAKPPARDDKVAEFKSRLLEAFQDAKISQSELARRVGGAQQAVGPWLDAKRPDMPKGANLLLLPEALGVSGHWLLTGHGPKTAPAGLADYDRGRIDGGREALKRLLHVLEEVITTTSVSADMDGFPSLFALLAQLREPQEDKARPPRPA